ncbi:hypothetical protein V6Z11_D13G072200 [Gossypium hirsutum]
MVAETTELEYWRLHIIRRDHKDQLYTIATDESNNLTHSLVCSLVHHIIPGKPYSPHCNTISLCFIV